MIRKTCSTPFVIALAVFLSVPVVAAGQIDIERDFLTGLSTGVGYAGSMPDILLGASVFHLFSDGGFGVIADFKMGHETIKGDPSYKEDWTTERVLEERPLDLPVQPQDRRSTRNDEWMVVNLGTVKPLTREFAIAAGAGAAYRTAIDEFTTDDAEFSRTEWYWVQNEAETGWELNLHGSLLFKAGRNVVLRFGYDRGPRMISFGGYWALSR